jgi:hypothetical protein
MTPMLPRTGGFSSSNGAIDVGLRPVMQTSPSSLSYVPVESGK